MFASIIIPTKNEEANIGRCLEAVFGQSTSFPFEVLVVDSGSQDRTLEVARRYPAHILEIAPSEFHHARTRNLGGTASSGEHLVFLSGDAIPANDRWLSALLKNFEDAAIAAVYGRQIPKPDATPERVFFVHHRYGTERVVRNASSNGVGKHVLHQFSNVNSAVRRTVWKQLPFPEDVNAYEDFSFAIQLAQHGHSIAYEPEAAVLHSHNYTLVRSFQQYFDSGVLYSRRQLWDGQQRDQIRADGLRYLRNEIRYLRRCRAGYRIPYVLCYEAARYFGLILGSHERLLPTALKRMVTSHRLFG